MLANSILGKLYIFYENSLFYSILKNIYRFFSNAYSNSVFRRILIGENVIQNWFENCKVVRALESLINKIETRLKRFAELLRPALDNSVFINCCRNSYVLKFDFIFVILIALTFIIPHEMWSNTYGLAFALVLFAGLLLLSIAEKRSIINPKKFGVFFFLFVLSCVFGYVVSKDRSNAIRVLVFLFTAFLFMWVVSSYINNKDRLRIVVQIIYVVTIVMAIVAIIQRIAGIEPNASLTNIELYDAVPGRVFSTVENPNNFAEVLVLFTPISTVYALEFKDNTKKFVASMLLVLPVIALLMTYSRSGWLSAALCVLMYLYFAKKSLIPCIAFAAIIAIPFLPAGVQQRLFGMFNLKDTSASFRIELWQSTLDMLAHDYNWIKGVGLGPNNFMFNHLPYSTFDTGSSVVHSQMLYLELIVEEGILGFVSFGMFFFEKMRDGFVSIYKARDPFVKRVIIACVSSFIGMMILCVFEYIWFYARVLFAYFILMGILISSIELVKQDGNKR